MVFRPFAIPLFFTDDSNELPGGEGRLARVHVIDIARNCMPRRGTACD